MSYLHYLIQESIGKNRFDLAENFFLQQCECKILKKEESTYKGRAARVYVMYSDSYGPMIATYYDDPKKKIPKFTSDKSGNEESMIQLEIKGCVASRDGTTIKRYIFDSSKLIPEHGSEISKIYMATNPSWPPRELVNYMIVNLKLLDGIWKGDKVKIDLDEWSKEDQQSGLLPGERIKNMKLGNTANDF